MAVQKRLSRIDNDAFFDNFGLIPRIVSGWISLAIVPGLIDMFCPKYLFSIV